MHVPSLNFDLGEDIDLLRQSVAHFAAAEVAPLAAEYGVGPAFACAEFADAGVLAPLLETLRSPLVGFTTLGLLLYVLIAKGKLPVRGPGVLLAFVCAPTLPYWMLIIGDFFAIVVVKQLFGGLGKNFMNPALGGRAFLMLCYPVAMTTWVVPGIGTDKWAGLLSGSVTMTGADVVTGATPLSADFMHGGLLPDVSLLDAFVGNVGGCIGEISALALLAGGLYLIARGVIRARIPVAYIATVAVLTFLFPMGGNDRLTWMAYQLFTGGLFLGAFFMATDYVTSPFTTKGKLFYGIFIGLLTFLIRHFASMNEGMSFAILLGNLMVPWFNAWGHQVPLGFKKAKKAKAKKEGGAD